MISYSPAHLTLARNMRSTLTRPCVRDVFIEPPEKYAFELFSSVYSQSVTGQLAV